MKHKKSAAFTLIELLMVVLIAGILAAVALPQYQRAVAKARVAEAQIMLDGIAKAQNVYRMANGEFASNLSALGVSLPCELSADGREYVCRYWHLGVIYPEEKSKYIEIFPRNQSGMLNFSLSYRQDGSMGCRAGADSDLQNFLCKDLGYSFMGSALVESSGVTLNSYTK